MLTRAKAAHKPREKTNRCKRQWRQSGPEVSLNLRWHFQESKPSAQKIGYRVSSVSEATYGLTAWAQLVADTSLIWDSLVVSITDPYDVHIDINSNASGISASAVYAYDMTRFNGTLVLNNTQFQYAAVQRQAYTVTRYSQVKS